MQMTCPSQKLTRGKYVVTHHALCSDWIQFSRVRFLKQTISRRTLWLRPFPGTDQQRSF